jgi:hypothetical protein
MTTNETPFESKMLQEVRRWRKEAYEIRQTLSPQEQAKRLNELLKEVGLSLAPGGGKRRHRRMPET